jgi:hypothetical protein
VSHEFRIYSQNGEDGIIEFLLDQVGHESAYAVEIGCGDGSECNTKLLRKKGWDVLALDLSCANAVVHREIVTPQNVIQIFSEYNVPDNFDLLSIDIDGMDYWVWKAIDRAYRPRIVVIEYNASCGPEAAVTIRYDPFFVWDGTDYFGASLMALVRLAATKGYTLVHCEAQGVNAFFVRDDLLDALPVPLRSPREIYRPPAYGVEGAGHQPSERKMVAL